MRSSQRATGSRRWFRPEIESLEDRIALSGDPLVAPPVIASVNGVLTATLTQTQGTAMVGDVSVINAWTYNDSYAGPTLWAQPGDLLDITLVNNLPDPEQITNLHTHGLHVSQIGNADNVLLGIPAVGGSNHYHIQIPADHPEGLYWYHPHHHGQVNAQIAMGLAGMLVIGRPDGGAPELDNLDQNQLILKNALLTGNQINIPATGSNLSAQTFTVNGQLLPILGVNNSTDSQWQVFNVVNAGNDAFYNLQVYNTVTETAVPMLMVALDGNPFTKAQQQLSVGMPPGRRWSFVIQPPTSGSDAIAGTYELRTTGFNSNHPNPSTSPAVVWPPTTLMTITYTGTATLQTAPVVNGGALTPPNNYFHDLADVPEDEIAAHRTVIFSNDFPIGNEFINGNAFPNTPIFQPRLNTVEEWTLINTTGTVHPFHYHTNPQQPINPTGGLDPRFSDVINVPAKSGGVNGQVVIRIEFLDFNGTAVYHCHRVIHEDHGMMALVNVIPEVPYYALGANKGAQPTVKVFSPVDDSTVAEFFAFDPKGRTGVSVAVGDVNGDGVYDIITGTLSVYSQIKVIDGTKLDEVDPVTNVILDSALLGKFTAFASNQRAAGVFVAAGDFNGDGLSDIVAGSGGGKNRIKIINATELDQMAPNGVILNTALIKQFEAFGATFKGGVRVATGDINGDGRIDLIAGAGPKSKPLVNVYNGKDLSLLTSFLAYDQKYRGGVFVASGLITGFGYADIITSMDSGPLVKVFANQLTMESHHVVDVAQVWSMVLPDAALKTGVRVTSLQSIVPDPPYGANKDAIVAAALNGNGTVGYIYFADIAPPDPPTTPPH